MEPPFLFSSPVDRFQYLRKLANDPICKKFEFDLRDPV